MQFSDNWPVPTVGLKKPINASKLYTIDWDIFVCIYKGMYVLWYLFIIITATIKAFKIFFSLVSFHCILITSKCSDMSEKTFVRYFLCVLFVIQWLLQFVVSSFWVCLGIKNQLLTIFFCSKLWTAELLCFMAIYTEKKAKLVS